MNELVNTTESEIKKAVNNMLKRCFGSNARIYGNEIVQGYKVPCFFTEMILASEEKSSSTTVLKSYNVYITFFQSESGFSESKAYKVLNKIRYDLIMNDPEKRTYILEVNGRYIQIFGINYSWAGNNKNRFQISMQLSYIDNTEIREDADLMEDIEIDWENDE